MPQGCGTWPAVRSDLFVEDFRTDAFLGLGSNEEHMARWGLLIIRSLLPQPPNSFSQGEIDILEGVNDQGPNVVSLHTSPGAYGTRLHMSSQS